ncbi:MAG: T9SS type A sorting domain-containing protein [Sediminibacterium sp.]|nr:T9SS type A sorting domain-containing protein [Sediminibacterium sp.]
MKKTKINRHTLTWLVVWCLFMLGRSQNVNVSGALVGNGSYATLGAAFTAINGGTQTGAAITVNIVGNTTESASALLLNGGWASMNIAPSGGASRVVSGTVVGPLIDLNGVQNVSINGLNTGGNSLTLSNLDAGNATTSTVRFINAASNNTVAACSILGASTGGTIGNIVFATAGAVSGNNNNSITGNTITAVSSLNLPTNLIYSAGTASVGLENTGNQVTNNVMSDFFNSTAVSIGVNLASNNTSWVISGNRFFQSAARVATVANTYNAILVSGGSNYTINSNIIGYSANNATGTMTLAGTIAVRFTGIAMSATAGGTLSTIQGNTVSAITLSTSSGAATAAGILCGISVTGGNVQIQNNVIGGNTGTNLLQGVPTTAQGAVVGINAGSTGSVSISSNTIGGLTSTGVTAAVSGAVSGINVSASSAALTITGNMIGNASADNMRAGTNGLTTGSSLASGINLPSTSTGTIIINSNTIRNFSSYGTNTSGYVRGIWTAAATGNASTYSITNNAISNLISNTANTTISNAQAAACGINLGVGTNGAVTGNTITNIALTNATVTTVNYAAGIGLSNATSSRIFGNRIYNITNAGVSTATASPNVAAGVIIRSGTTDVTVYNNFISLGNGFSSGCTFIGVLANHGSTPDPVDRIYFNTINIEGTAASGSQSTFGFHRGDFTTTLRTQTVDIKNNLITNTRTGGTGSHFAIANNFGNAGSATGWSTGASNNNVLNAAAATIGFWNGVSYNFSGWQTNSLGDANSFSGITVTYVNSANDLHLNMGLTPTLIESNGQTIAGLTNDIDGQVRPGPAGSVNGGAFLPDIGADEIDAVPLDILPPIITQNPLTFTCSTADRTFTATIADLSGAPTTGTAQPRVYFRKNAGAWFSNQGALVSGTGNNGVWSFTISSSAMGGLSAGDVINYYVIAQDVNGNIGSNPSAGLVATNVNAVTTAPTSPNAYTIAGNLSGLYTVGATGTYSTLTAAANAYNTSCLTGSVVFSLIDATYPSETFPITFLSNVNASSTNSLLIQPAAGVSPTITGSSTTAIIVINGGDYISINGSNGNTVNSICPLVKASRNLTLVNTNVATGSGVVSIQTTAGGDGASNNAVMNCIIAGSGSLATGVAVNISGPTIGSGTGSANNNNNSIINNLIRNAQVGIFSAGQSAILKNNNNVFDLNDLNDVSPTSIGRVGIMVLFEDGPKVRSNTIANILSSGSIDVIGITLGSNALANSVTTGAEVTNAVVTGNSISNLVQSNTYSSGGIILAATSTGTTLIANNAIADVFANGTAGDFAAGIYYGGGAGVLNVFHNSVRVTGTLTGASQPNFALAINGVTPAVNIQNNILICTGSNGFNGNTGIGLAYTSTVGNYANLTSSNNDIYVTGTSSSIGRVGSLTAGTQQVSLSNWQTETGKDLNSVSILPNFASATDLHLVANANAGIENAGTPIPAVINDADCDTRNTTGPDMGFDEVCTSPSTVTLSASASTVCAGTTVTLSITAGVLNDAAAWSWYSGSCGGTAVGTGTSISVSPASTTDYFVNGTGGCVSALPCTSITIVTNPSPSITVNSGAICSGNSFVIVPSGASSYTFSGGSATVTPTTNTNYTVTGTNTLGCIGSAVASVTVNALPTITVNSGAVCNGNSFVLVPGGAASYTFSSGSATVTPAVTTNYTVTGTSAAGCQGSAVSSVSVNSLPTLTASTSASLICVGQSASLTASGASTYSWSSGANTAVIAVSPTVTTTYTVNGTDINGCSNSMTVTQNVSTCTGLSSLTSAGNSISVYPNPGNGVFYLQLSEDAKGSDVTVVNALGEVVFNLTANSSESKLDLQTLTNGIYFVKVEKAGQSLAVKKIVKE